MQFINKNSNNNYEMTEEQFDEIQDAMCNIGSLLDIMKDYCEYNAEKAKICPLIKMVEYIQSEKRRITNKF